ncbi:MAG: phosphohistidine phosphatase SixA [Deltaproteobacteria bacterium]|nr:phosphohistidine phosphatase SixA [Deltaproteobacteria bacterium]
MKVYLVQHGKAKSKEEDPRRGLSEEGIEASGKVALWLSGRSIQVNAIFHSDKLRARETARIFSEHLTVSVKTEERDGLSPNDDPAIWKEALEKEDEDIMLVGHLPQLSKLASLLLCDTSDREMVSFTNSGVLCLEKEGRRWVVKWMIIPQLIS